MREIPVTNRTTSNLHIGGKVIRPGVTRMVDEGIVPAHLQMPSDDAPADAPPADPIAELLAGNVDAVKAALAEAPDLDAIEAAETAGKGRSGVLDAIALERLRRAADTTTD